MKNLQEIKLKQEKEDSLLQQMFNDIKSYRKGNVTLQDIIANRYSELSPMYDEAKIYVGSVKMLTTPGTYGRTYFVIDNGGFNYEHCLYSTLAKYWTTEDLKPNQSIVMLFNSEWSENFKNPSVIFIEGIGQKNSYDNINY